MSVAENGARLVREMLHVELTVLEDGLQHGAAISFEARIAKRGL